LPVRPALLLLIIAVSAAGKARSAPVVEAEPSRLVLGPSARAEITVRSAGPSLHSAVSAGTLTQGRAAEGLTHFLWVPPAEARAPLLVLFAFWDVEAPGLSDITVLGLPCAGRTELSIDTEPGARVTVEVGGTRFGPRRADGQGRLRVPVEVAPNVHEARVVAEISETSKVRVLPLAPQPSPWLLALFPERSLDGRPVRALLVVPDTEEAPGLALLADGARVERDQSAPGRWLGRIVPDAGARQVTVTARTGDGALRASAILDVLSPAPAPPPTPPPGPPRPLRFDLSGAVGGFVGGGANSGPAATLTLGVGLPSLPLVAELELGIRGASYSEPASGLGVQKSSLLVVPVELGIRWEALQHRNLRLAVRGGGGMLFGSHHLSSTFDGEFTEGALGWEVFAAFQAGLVAGPVEPFLELRGSLAHVSTDHLDAHPGGGMLLVGVRGMFE
jgi:hypothetical protein